MSLSSDSLKIPCLKTSLESDAPISAAAAAWDALDARACGETGTVPEQVQSWRLLLGTVFACNLALNLGGED